MATEDENTAHKGVLLSKMATLDYTQGYIHFGGCANSGQPSRRLSFRSSGPSQGPFPLSEDDQNPIEGLTPGWLHGQVFQQLAGSLKIPVPFRSSRRFLRAQLSPRQSRTIGWLSHESGNSAYRRA